MATMSPWRTLTSKPRKSKTSFPVPRASARARAVASPNARFNRGTAKPTPGPFTPNIKPSPSRRGGTPRRAPAFRRGTSRPRSY